MNEYEGMYSSPTCPLCLNNITRVELNPMSKLYYLYHDFDTDTYDNFERIFDHVILCDFIDEDMASNANNTKYPFYIILYPGDTVIYENLLITYESDKFRYENSVPQIHTLEPPQDIDKSLLQRPYLFNEVFSLKDGMHTSESPLGRIIYVDENPELIINKIYIYYNNLFDKFIKQYLTPEIYYYYDILEEYSRNPQSMDVPQRILNKSLIQIENEKDILKSYKVLLSITE